MSNYLEDSPSYFKHDQILKHMAYYIYITIGIKVQVEWLKDHPD